MSCFGFVFPTVMQGLPLIWTYSLLFPIDLLSSFLILEFLCIQLQPMERAEVRVSQKVKLKYRCVHQIP